MRHPAVTLLAIAAAWVALWMLGSIATAALSASS